LIAAGEAARIDTPLGTVTGIAREGMRVGDPAVAVIRPQAITLHEPSDSAIGENRFPATIASLNFLGDVIETMAVSGGERVLLMLDPYSQLHLGEEVILHVPPEHCAIVPADPQDPAE
jgi:ABC-type Fe3+/spermidine/putrescine transport system ATPase subunit